MFLSTDYSSRLDLLPLTSAPHDSPAKRSAHGVFIISSAPLIRLQGLAGTDEGVRILAGDWLTIIRAGDQLECSGTGIDRLQRQGLGLKIANPLQSNRACCCCWLAPPWPGYFGVRPEYRPNLPYSNSRFILTHTHMLPYIGIRPFEVPGKPLLIICAPACHNSTVPVFVLELIYSSHLYIHCIVFASLRLEFFLVDS